VPVATDAFCHTAHCLQLHSFKASATAVQWSPQNTHTLFSSSFDGSIVMCDTRVGKAVSSWSCPTVPSKGMESFFESEQAFAKAGSDIVPPVSCISVGCEGAMLAAGTGSFVRFWDVRSATSPGAGVLGEYVESHAQCITALAFHPTLTSTLLSGDESGLVNVFDTSVAGEVDALSGSLAADSGISRLGVFGPQGACVYATSQTCGLQLWNLGSGDSMLHLPALHCTFLEAGVDCQYLVDCTYDEGSQQLALWAGSRSGALHLYTVQARGLQPRAQLAAGHTEDVRCIARVPAGGSAVFVSGAEDGSLAAWGSSSLVHSSSQGAAGPSPATVIQGGGASSGKRHKKKHRKRSQDRRGLHTSTPF